MEITQGDISDDEYDNEAEVIKLPIEETNNANEDDEEFHKFTMTRSGRVVKTKTNYDLATMDLTQVEFGYQANLREMSRLEFSEEEYTLHHEFSGIGSVLRVVFFNTRKLKSMNYNEAMGKY